MKDRRFGIEIECGIGSRTGRDQDRVLNALMEKSDAGEIGTQWHTGWGFDGTWMEFRSPILQGKKGFKELHTAMNTIVECGGYVTVRDGMHIHHDAPEFIGNPKLTALAVLEWNKLLPLIHAFVSPRRIGDGAYACPAYNANQLWSFKNALRTGSAVHVDGRHDLNVRALERHGTIEIRLHEGILDPVQAEAWIRFGQAFLNKVAGLKSGMRSVENHEEMLKRLRTTKAATDALLSRPRVMSARRIASLAA